MSTVLSAELRQQFSLSPEHELWKGEKPDSVVFATSSVRKALVFHWILNDFSFNLEEMGITVKGPGLDGVSTPEQIQDYFSEYIYNGDMQLMHEVYLGEFEGVPFYAHPQVGETDRNDRPLDEAKNKLLTLAERFVDQRTYIISSDVVGASSAYASPEDSIKLGKPVNFKRTAEATWNEVPWQDVDTFVEWYKETILTVGATLEHISAIVAFSVLEEEMESQQITIVQTLTGKVRENLSVFLDAGLGGVWQQLQPFFDDQLKLLGDAAAEIIPMQVEMEDDLIAEQLVYAHIIGVQALALLKLVLTMHNKVREVVVFEKMGA